MKGTDNALLREDQANEGNIYISPEIRVYFPESTLKSRAAYSVEDGFGSLVSGSWSPYGKQLVFVTTEVNSSVSRGPAWPNQVTSG